MTDTRIVWSKTLALLETETSAVLGDFVDLIALGTLIAGGGVGMLGGKSKSSMESKSDNPELELSSFSNSFKPESLTESNSNSRESNSPESLAESNSNSRESNSPESLTESNPNSFGDAN